MAKVTIYDMTGKSVGERELNDAIFAVTPNKAVLHEVVKNYLANQRQGTQSTLTRTEVSGGGKKPWRQKGTGSCPSGFDPCSPVDSRRRGAGPQAPFLPLHHQPQDEGRWPEERSFRQGCRE